MKEFQVENLCELATAPRQVEPLSTVREAARVTGIKYWLLMRAVKSGDIPHYRLGNTRMRVRLSDIEAVIQASRSEADRK